MFPRRVFTAEDMNKTLVELELAPSASIVILPVSRPVPLWDSSFPFLTELITTATVLADSRQPQLDPTWINLISMPPPLSSQAGSVMQLSSRLAGVSGQSWARCSTLYWPCGDFSAPLYLQARPLGNQLQEVKPTLSPTHTPAWVLTKPRGETFCCHCYCSHLHPAQVTFLNHWVPGSKHIK